jgi:hypothetical protein
MGVESEGSRQRSPSSIADGGLMLIPLFGSEILLFSAVAPFPADEMTFTFPQRTHSSIIGIVEGIRWTGPFFSQLRSCKTSVGFEKAFDSFPKLKTK